MQFPPKGNLLRRLDQHLKMFEVRCSEIPDMRVRVLEGSYWDNGAMFIEFPGGVSREIEAPTGNRAKAVLIGVSTSSNIVVIDGEESSSTPVVPECPKNVMPCAVLLLQPSCQHITQEMIFDVRPVFYARYPVSHNDLTDRNEPEAHTISAISGLNDALEARPDEEQMSLWLKTKADQNGTNRCKFVFNKGFGGVLTEDLDLIFERGDTLRSILRFPKEPNGSLKYSTDNGTTWSILGYAPEDSYSKTQIDNFFAEMDAKKENVIERKSGFNLELGTENGTVAEGDHDHDELYAQIEHDHDGMYAQIEHSHDGVYSETGHNHDGVYAPVNHTHPGLDAEPSADIYVDCLASKSGSGSVTSPFRTISEAADIAEDGDVIHVTTGTYNESFTLQPGVSLHGSTVKTIINGDVNFGDAGDTKDHTPVSIRDIQFGNKNSAKTVSIFYTCEVYNCNFYSAVVFNRPDKSMTVMNTNYRVNSTHPAITIKGSYNQVLGKINNDGVGKAIQIVDGQTVMSHVMVTSKNISETIGMSGGTLSMDNSVVNNLSTASAARSINASGSITSMSNPNSLFSMVINKDVFLGDKITFANGIRMMSGSVSGTKIYRTSDSHIPFVEE